MCFLRDWRSGTGAGWGRNCFQKESGRQARSQARIKEWLGFAVPRVELEQSV